MMILVQRRRGTNLTMKRENLSSPRKHGRPSRLWSRMEWRKKRMVKSMGWTNDRCQSQHRLINWTSWIKKPNGSFECKSVKEALNISRCLELGISMNEHAIKPQEGASLDNTDDEDEGRKYSFRRIRNPVERFMIKPEHQRRSMRARSMEAGCNGYLPSSASRGRPTKRQAPFRNTNESSF